MNLTIRDLPESVIAKIRLTAKAISDGILAARSKGRKVSL
jgi:plasmid stability protein